VVVATDCILGDASANAVLADAGTNAILAVVAGNDPCSTNCPSTCPPADCCESEPFAMYIGIDAPALGTQTCALAGKRCEGGVLHYGFNDQVTVGETSNGELWSLHLGIDLLCSGDGCVVTVEYGLSLTGGAFNNFPGISVVSKRFRWDSNHCECPAVQIVVPGVGSNDDGSSPDGEDTNIYINIGCDIDSTPGCASHGGRGNQTGPFMDCGGSCGGTLPSCLEVQAVIPSNDGTNATLRTAYLAQQTGCTYTGVDQFSGAWEENFDASFECYFLSLADSTGTEWVGSAGGSSPGAVFSVLTGESPAKPDTVTVTIVDPSLCPSPACICLPNGFSTLTFNTQVWQAGGDFPDGYTDEFAVLSGQGEPPGVCETSGPDSLLWEGSDSLSTWDFQVVYADPASCGGSTNCNTLNVFKSGVLVWGGASDGALTDGNTVGWVQCAGTYAGPSAMPGVFS